MSLSRHQTQLATKLLDLVERVTRAYQAKRKITLLTPIERKLEGALKDAFRKQGRIFLSRLSSKKGDWPVAEAAGPRWESEFEGAAKETQEAFERPLTASVASALVAGSKASIATFGMDIDFSLKGPRAIAYLKEHGAQLVTGINQVSKDQIRGIIAQAMEDGWSYNQTALELTSKFEQFAVGSPLHHIESRAHLIAVTEASHAYEHGNKEGIEQLIDAGLEMEKAWIVADTNACDDCATNGDDGWIPFDDAFSSGWDTAEDSHPGCRCATEYRSVGAGKEGD